MSEKREKVKKNTMSHWLKNVNNLLTKLDDQVETVVEERAFAQSESPGNDQVGKGIDDILAKRGLSSINSKEVEEAETGKSALLKMEDPDEEKRRLQFEEKTRQAESEVSAEFMVDHKATGNTESFGGSSVVDATQDIAQQDLKRSDFKTLEKGSSILPRNQSVEPIASGSNTSSAPLSDFISNEDETTGKEAGGKSIENNESKAAPSPLNSTTMKYEPQNSKSSLQTHPGSTSLSIRKEQRRSHRAKSPDGSRKEIRELTMERKEAQKEARTLRRHIVSLNDQLEAAESELQAQRKELERAAERMEKDRVRHKDEKEVTKKQKDAEITQLKTEHTKSMEAQQTRFEEQLDRYRKKLSEEEQRRKQEGGDWNQEMSNAIDREQEIRQTLTVMEDEKSVLLTQISTLQGQQAALGSRLESLSQAADNAMERERDAEKRLDLALNQHARQISHRQVCQIFQYVFA